MKNRILHSFQKLCVLSFLSLTGAITAEAFELVPFIATINPKTKRSLDYTIKTESTDPVAVEISIQQRGMDENGQDILSEDDDSFLIFPNQFIVTKSQPQTVRVQWLGSNDDKETEQDLKTEKAFRLIAEQVPVDLEARQPKSGGSIKIMLKYVSSLYVTPGESASKLVVESVTKDPKDPHKLVLRIRNTGTRHLIVPNDESLKMVFKGSNPQETVEVKSADLAGFTGENILVGATRVFKIAKPSSLGAMTITSAEVHYKEPHGD